MLVGCSFTDPSWQQVVPWSVRYSNYEPCVIVAKAGMGIKGICTEAVYWLQILQDIKKVIVVLPTLWRMDIEMDEETWLCNSMTDLLEYSDGIIIAKKPAVRKWVTSGGLNYNRDSAQGKIFAPLYRHQGFFVLLKEHFRALHMLQTYCRDQSIQLHVTAIQNPLNQLEGLDFKMQEIQQQLSWVKFDKWLRFNGKFIDELLGHRNHPTDQEHAILCETITNLTMLEKTF